MAAFRIFHCCYTKLVGGAGSTAVATHVIFVARKYLLLRAKANTFCFLKVNIFFLWFLYRNPSHIQKKDRTPNPQQKRDKEKCIGDVDGTTKRSTKPLLPIRTN